MALGASTLLTIGECNADWMMIRTRRPAGIACPRGGLPKIMYDISRLVVVVVVDSRLCFPFVFLGYIIHVYLSILVYWVVL